MKNTKLAIHVVEDTMLYQRLICKLLEQMPAEVMMYESAEQAAAQLPHNKPDLAILDYNLDGEMTGLDMVKTLRLQHPQVHIILFTTRADLDTSENRGQYGDFEFVAKNKDGLRNLKLKINYVMSLMQAQHNTNEQL